MSLSEEQKKTYREELGKLEAQTMRETRKRLSTADFNSLAIIGRGAFGEVRKAYRQAGGGREGGGRGSTRLRCTLEKGALLFFLVRPAYTPPPTEIKYNPTTKPPGSSALSIPCSGPVGPSSLRRGCRGVLAVAFYVALVAIVFASIVGAQPSLLRFMLLLLLVLCRLPSLPLSTPQRSPDCWRRRSGSDRHVTTTSTTTMPPPPTTHQYN